jgi:tellurite resistance protein
MRFAWFFAAPAAAQDNGGAPVNTTPLALLALIIAVFSWFALRTFVRALRARKTEAAIGGNFNDFALEALVNAAKIDGRIAPNERTTIAAAIAELGGGDVDAAFTRAGLSKDELVDYLGSKAHAFTHAQKQWLLKSLLAVFVADGVFDEAEHAALLDYTAAIGFDRGRAPDMLRNLARDFSRGNIT